MYMCVCVCVLKDIRPQNLYSSPVTPEQVVAITAPGAALRPLWQKPPRSNDAEPNPFEVTPGTRRERSLLTTCWSKSALSS